MRHTEANTERWRRQVPLLVDGIGATLELDAQPLSTAAVDWLIADMLRDDLSGEGE